MERRTCTKLSRRYYGPLQIEKKINPVAYRFKLPVNSTIFPVFHASLLKPFIGNIDEIQPVELPSIAIGVHPVIIPTHIEGYRVVQVKVKRVEQVLVK